MKNIIWIIALSIFSISVNAKPVVSKKKSVVMACKREFAPKKDIKLYKKCIKDKMKGL